MRGSKVTIAIVVGVLALAAVGVTGAAVLDSSITIDDPDLEHAEVSVTFNGSANASIVATDINGTEVFNETVSGSANETIVREIHVNDSGDYSVTVSEGNTTDGVDIEDATVEVVSRTLLEETTLNVTDPANESIMVDVAFEGDETATIEVVNADTNTTVETLTIDGTEGDLLTREIAVSNESNYTTTVTTLGNESAFGEVYVSLGGGATGGGGFTVAGASIDPSVGIAIVALALLIGAGIAVGRWIDL